jgi:hypothetical protein
VGYGLDVTEKPEIPQAEVDGCGMLEVDDGCMADAVLPVPMNLVNLLLDMITDLDGCGSQCRDWVDLIPRPVA